MHALAFYIASNLYTWRIYYGYVSTTPENHVFPDEV